MRSHFLTACYCACLLLSLAHASIDKKLQEAHKQRASGNVLGAIATLRGITAKQPDNARALALLGDSLFESGDATEAHAMYVMAPPPLPSCCWRLCDTCASYSSCLKLAADDISCMDGMSMLYLRTGNPQLALPLLERITAAVAGACLHSPAVRCCWLTLCLTVCM
jgi:hypothetical protein